MRPRVAIYSSVSTADQDPDAQLFALREYVDHVTGADLNRRLRQGKDKAFQALMADARQRRVDCVLVWKYDRFAHCRLLASTSGRPRRPLASEGDRDRAAF